MRILFVSDTCASQVNGVARTLTELHAALAQMGHSVEVICPSDGYRTLPCPSYPEIRLAVFAGRRMARQIEAYAPDHIHIVTEGPLGRAARRYARANALPYSTHYMTRFPEMLKQRLKIVPQRLTASVLKRFHKGAAVTFVPTETLGQSLIQNSYTQLQTLPLAVDTERFTPGLPELWPDLPRPIFAYVGRAVKDKNIAEFLSLDLPGSKVVVGDGPEMTAFRRDFPKAAFTGYLRGEDLVRAYRAMDVCVFPSRVETFGLVILEALACGTPVAAHPLMGPLDILGESDAGAMNTDLKAACLNALKISPAQCRAHAETFRWDDVATSFLNSIRPNGAF